MTPNKTSNKLTAPNNDGKIEKALEALLTKGIPLSITLGVLTKKDFDVLYATAYNLYAEKKYPRALANFSFMTIYDHFDKRGWIGSAACWQVLKNYKNALNCYSKASALDIKDPLPIFHSVECYIILKMYSEARSALKVVEPLIKNNPEFASFQRGAAKMKEFLQNK